MTFDEINGLSDAEIARRVRNTANKLPGEFGDGVVMSCAQIIIAQAIKVNSTTTTIECKGFSVKGKVVGDYKLTVERMKR